MLDPKELPASIIKRLPIRTDFNDNYYFDIYQGIPEGGYTQIFEKMLHGVTVLKGANYLANKQHWDTQATKVVYTGPIDEYFNYCYGELNYRTTKFDHIVLDRVKDYQGVAQVNYTDLECVKTGFANGVAPGFPLTEKEKWDMVDKAEVAYGQFLDALGVDWRNDPNSEDTPRRVAKAYVFDLFAGRYNAMSDITSFPSDGYDGIVIERNIPLTSMC